MKHILVINLKRYGDIVASAGLLSSIRQSNPDSKIHLLIYDEFKSICPLLKNVFKVHTINREEITTFHNNSIYSNSFAYEAFFRSLREVKDINWHNIVNYSNDLVSTYVTSFLKNDVTNTSGISFNHKHQVTYSNDWSIVFNDLLPEYGPTPINFIDNFNKILNTSSSQSCDSISIKEAHSQNAFTNFNKIRNEFKPKHSDLKIIGIQLKSSDQNKDLEVESIIRLIGFTLDCESTFPILLIAPNQEERNFVNSLNKHFNNRLITVESDFIALPSVLMNLDLLITPDTVIKHLADQLKTPILEISQGTSPLFKQGSINPNNLILTKNYTKRKIYNKLSTEADFVNVENIIEGIRYFFNHTSKPNISNTDTLYVVSKDQFGTAYRPIAGGISYSFEVSRLTSRYLIHRLLNNDGSEELDKNIFSLPTAHLQKWIVQEKQSIVATTKNILNTLRQLIKTKNNPQNTIYFINSLNILFEGCEKNQLTAIPTILFRARTEALTNNNTKNNMKNIETLLYNLKNEIQVVINTVSLVESQITTTLYKKHIPLQTNPQAKL